MIKILIIALSDDVGMPAHANAGVDSDSDTTQAPFVTPNHCIQEPASSPVSFPATLGYHRRKAFEVLKTCHFKPGASTRSALLSGRRVMGKRSLGKMLR